MSRMYSCLGSQEPEGGVVLGLALLKDDFGILDLELFYSCMYVC